MYRSRPFQRTQASNFHFVSTASSILASATISHHFIRCSSSSSSEPSGPSLIMPASLSRTQISSQNRSPCPSFLAFPPVMASDLQSRMFNKSQSPYSRTPLSTVLRQYPEAYSPSAAVDCTLDAAFSLSYKRDDYDAPPGLFDTFELSSSPNSCDLSPISSASSDYDSIASTKNTSRSSFDAFVTTRSRVVRVSEKLLRYDIAAVLIRVLQLFNLPAMPQVFLSTVFRSPHVWMFSDIPILDLSDVSLA